MHPIFGIVAALGIAFLVGCVAYSAGRHDRHATEIELWNQASRATRRAAAWKVAAGIQRRKRRAEFRDAMRSGRLTGAN